MTANFGAMPVLHVFFDPVTRHPDRRARPLRGRRTLVGARPLRRPLPPHEDDVIRAHLMDSRSAAQGPDVDFARNAMVTIAMGAPCAEPRSARLYADGTRSPSISTSARRTTSASTSTPSWPASRSRATRCPPDRPFGAAWCASSGPGYRSPATFSLTGTSRAARRPAHCRPSTTSRGSGSPTAERGSRAVDEQRDDRVEHHADADSADGPAQCPRAVAGHPVVDPAQ